MTKNFRFHYTVYETAYYVEARASENSGFMEIDWGNQEVASCLYKPSKTTLLHYYIFAIISVDTRWDYRKNSDMYEDYEISEIENTFQTYNVKIDSFTEYKSRNLSEPDDLPEVFYSWFVDNEESFQELWEKITEEVFQLLFANRAFLLNFNNAIAEIIRYEDVVPSEFRNSKGYIKRPANIPSWVKKAVYFRDRGKCVYCQKDLSGLLSTDRSLNYDHIVPLKLFGSNDPCNFQLLCRECNLEKSGKQASTSTKYSPWW